MDYCVTTCKAYSCMAQYRSTMGQSYDPKHFDGSGWVSIYVQGGKSIELCPFHASQIFSDLGKTLLELK